MSLVFEPVIFNAEERKIIDRVQFLNYEPLVVGSYSIKSQRYSSDIDALALITGQKERNKFNEYLQDMLRRIELEDDMFFLEFKIQYNDGSKIKFFNSEKVNIPQKDFNKIYFMKLDLIVFLDGVFKEFGMNYYFHYPDDLVGDMLKDIKQFKKEGLYLKVLKRYFSIAKVKGDKVQANFISKFLNSHSGRDYELLNNLKTIIILLENYGEDLRVRDMVRVELNRLGIIPKVSKVKEKIGELSNRVNSEAKRFLEIFLSKKI